MVTCSGCGRVIERVPDWMTGVKVEFICTNCPNRQTRNIAFVNFETEGQTVPVVEEEETTDVEEVADEEIDV